VGIKHVSLVRLWRSRPRSGERARPAELKRRAAQSFSGWALWSNPSRNQGRMGHPQVCG